MCNCSTPSVVNCFTCTSELWKEGAVHCLFKFSSMSNLGFSFGFGKASWRRPPFIYFCATPSGVCPTAEIFVPLVRLISCSVLHPPFRCVFHLEWPLLGYVSCLDKGFRMHFLPTHDY